MKSASKRMLSCVKSVGRKGGRVGVSGFPKTALSRPLLPILASHRRPGVFFVKALELKSKDSIGFDLKTCRQQQPMEHSLDACPSLPVRRLLLSWPLAHNASL